MKYAELRRRAEQAERDLVAYKRDVVVRELRTRGVAKELAVSKRVDGREVAMRMGLKPLLQAAEREAMRELAEVLGMVATRESHTQADGETRLTWRIRISEEFP